MLKTFLAGAPSLGQGHSANIFKKVCPRRRAQDLLADDCVYSTLLAGSLTGEAGGNLLSAKGEIKKRPEGRLGKLT